MSENLRRICEKLGYHFQDLSLLELALSHRSAKEEYHNERLEFLGDSLLNFVIAEKLFQMFESANEGDLTRSRASLVKKNTLVDLAKKLELGQYLLLGNSE